MSNKAHRGRCFRSKRKTIARKLRQGEPYESHPVRWKVPAVIKPFLTGNANQLRARQEQFGLAIARYAQHHALTGKGPAVRAASPD